MNAKRTWPWLALAIVALSAQCTFATSRILPDYAWTLPIGPHGLGLNGYSDWTSIRLGIVSFTVPLSAPMTAGVLASVALTLCVFGLLRKPE